MKEPKTLQDAGLFLLRVPLGLYMAVAGWGKVQDEINEGFGHFYRGSFTRLKPDWLPAFFDTAYGYAIPWLELAVGVAVIFGVLTRFFSVIGFLMLTSFTIALALYFETIKAQPEAANHPFNSNYIQICAYLLLVLIGPGRWAVDYFVFGKKKG